MANKENKGLHKELAIIPMVTEKGTHLNAINQYVFGVPLSANKTMVAQAIWSKYGVKPLKVNIVRRQGKYQFKGGILGKRSDWKKAVVVVAKGTAFDPYKDFNKKADKQK
ncbi:MAG: 50S ribosomal protein L23 [bacterium]